MADAVATTYGGVEIVYNERSDVWRFTLRGRERSASTLAKAKEAIARPEPKEKAFEPTDAYFCRYGGGAKLARITSLADGSGYGGIQVWCTIGGQRTKESLGDFYEVSPENDLILAECKAIDEQIEKLNSKRNAKFRGMKKLSIPGVEVAQ